ncbi:MAG TPA: alkaline phosphatase family protein, partial [Micromonosporaceae bacterium]
VSAAVAVASSSAGPVPGAAGGARQHFSAVRIGATGAINARSAAAAPGTATAPGGLAPGSDAVSGAVSGGRADLPGRTKPSAPSRTPRMAPPGTNLLVNPNAEAGTCTTSGYDAMTVPGWTVTDGSADSVCYGAVGFPRPDVPAPADRGRAFFSGGATGDSTMTQIVNVSSAADAIDHRGVTYRLGAWLGGWAGQNDRTTVNVSFLDNRGHLLGSDLLEPVTNSDRNSVSGFVSRRTSGWLPFETRQIIVSVSFTWTAGDTTDGYADDLSFSVDAPVRAPQLVAPASNVPQFDHVFVVFMSGQNALANEAPAGGGHYVIGNPAARYLNRTVAVMGSMLGRMYATTHPGDPNQLAVSGGSTFGWTTDPSVGSDTINAPNIGGSLEAAGLTWKAYAEGAYGGCDVTEHNNAAGGNYLPDEEPFMMYRDVVSDQNRCAAHNQPLTTLATDLQSAATTPSLVWFAPNDIDNMVGGGVAAGDKWLSQTLPAIFASPAWTQQRSLMIITWDQSYSQSFGPGFPNHVATYVLGSQDLVKPGYTSPVRYTDFSLARTIEDALGVGALTSNDAYARPLSDIWSDTGGGSGGERGQGDGGGAATSLSIGK